MRRWRIHRWVKRPKHTRDIEFTCHEGGCMRDALLPVDSLCRVEAQVRNALVYDPASASPNMPDVIECPHCRRLWDKNA